MSPVVVAARDFARCCAFGAALFFLSFLIELACSRKTTAVSLVASCVLYAVGALVFAYFIVGALEGKAFRWYCAAGLLAGGAAQRFLVCKPVLFFLDKIKARARANRRAVLEKTRE